MEVLKMITSGSELKEAMRKDGIDPPEPFNPFDLPITYNFFLRRYRTVSENKTEINGDGTDQHEKPPVLLTENQSRLRMLKDSQEEKVPVDPMVAVRKKRGIY